MSVSVIITVLSPACLLATYALIYLSSSDSGPPCSLSVFHAPWLFLCCFFSAVFFLNLFQHWHIHCFQCFKLTVEATHRISIHCYCHCTVFNIWKGVHFLHSASLWTYGDLTTPCRFSILPKLVFSVRPGLTFLQMFLSLHWFYA